MGVATSRWSAPKSGSKLGEGEVYLTNTGLLMEAAEGGTWFWLVWPTLKPSVNG